MKPLCCLFMDTKRLPVLLNFGFDCTCIRHYSPRRQGGSRRTALARITGISPLRGSLRAAPIACSRYHPGLWLGRSIIIRLLTRVGLVQNQPQCETARHRLLCGRMGTALHLPRPSLMRDHSPHRWSWRILQRRFNPPPGGSLVSGRIPLPDIHFSRKGGKQPITDTPNTGQTGPEYYS